MKIRLLVFGGMVAAWFVAWGLVVVAVAAFQKNTLQPAQPIEYPHYIHVQKVGLQCTYCHQYAEKSIYAGIPQAKFCMQCHESIATDRPEIIKLTNYYKSGQPVPWVRVYTEPDWVYFSHKAHVLRGLKCQECHGPVEFFTTCQQVPSLFMGWCLECHNQRGAPRECNFCHK